MSALPSCVADLHPLGLLQVKTIGDMKSAYRKWLLSHCAQRTLHVTQYSLLALLTGADCARGRHPATPGAPRCEAGAGGGREEAEEGGGRREVQVSAITALMDDIKKSCRMTNGSKT